MENKTISDNASCFLIKDERLKNECHSTPIYNFLKNEGFKAQKGSYNIGFGGVINGGKLPVNMRENFKPEIFKAFESFDYNIVRTENDFYLLIIEKETGIIVADV